MNHIPVIGILLITLSGLFGWMLGKFPDKVGYDTIVVAIMLAIMVLLKVK